DRQRAVEAPAVEGRAVGWRRGRRLEGRRARAGVARLDPRRHAAGDVVPVLDAVALERADPRARAEPARAEHGLRPVEWDAVATGSRRSTTHSPRRTASHASRAVYGRGFAAWSGISPRFLPTFFSNWGGFGGRSRMMNSTNAARSRSCNAGLKRRSKPIVEPAFHAIARPHPEPAPWAG